MTQAEYEEVKAQVLAEQKAERRAREKERERINHEAWHMFDGTEREYLPKLVAMTGRKRGNYDCAAEWKGRIDRIIENVLYILGERNRKTAYLNGRAEEANKLLAEMLERIIKE